MIDNLRFIIYTNEKNFDLGELCIKYFLKFSQERQIKISLVSNKFPHNNFKYSDVVSYLSGDVEFNGNGSHFAETMTNVLKKIEEKYIFYFCDDYFLFKNIKYDELSELLEMIECGGVDYFGFDEIWDVTPIGEYNKYVSNCENKYKGRFYIRKPGYRYLFSVQPCIWKKESLCELLNKHKSISLHDLDETLESIKSDNKYLSLCNDMVSLSSFVDVEKTGYYVIAYHEIVRHGCFWLPENGYSLDPSTPLVQFTYNLIKEEKLLKNPNFKQLLSRYF
jgi:hypothetical protein